MSSEAVNKAKSLISQYDIENLALRVEVSAGGCSGFTYALSFDSESSPEDLRQEFDGLPVVVDLESASLLKGARIDYEDGLSGTGFCFSNPNATRSCGCGKSFC